MELSLGIPVSLNVALFTHHRNSGPETCPLTATMTGSVTKAQFSNKQYETPLGHLAVANSLAIWTMRLVPSGTLSLGDSTTPP